MKTYTVEQLSEMLQVDPETIRRYFKEGKLKGFMIGREYRATEGDLFDYVEKNRKRVK